MLSLIARKTKIAQPRFRLNAYACYTLSFGRLAIGVFMITWVLVGVAAYLLVGLRFAFKGRLAFMVNTQVAVVDMRGPVSRWKKVVFKFLLRLGVMLLYPFFLIWG